MGDDELFAILKKYFPNMTPELFASFRSSAGGGAGGTDQAQGANRTPMGPPITAPGAPGSNANLIGPPVTVPPSGVPAGTNPMEAYLRSIPGYRFAFSEGQRAVQTGAASKGTLLTGGTQKALARFGTGLADQTYGNQFNRFLSLADLGQRTAVAPF